MNAILSEKIFTFLHRFIEQRFHLNKISKILRKIAKFENPIIFDIGSNEGESIDFFSNLYKNSKIYSFEPEKKSFLKLKKKYEANEKIFLFNFAFGNKTEELKLKINIKSSTSTLSKINENSKYYKFKSFILNAKKKNIFVDEEKVKVKKVDDFVCQNNINFINILKIDTEGFELNVIEGAKETLKKTKIIIVEFHLNDMYLNYEPKKIEKLLSDKNFTLVKAIKFPFMQYEDRVYINNNLKI